MSVYLGFSDVSFGALPAALLHSLWQGALISLVVLVVMRRVPVRRPELRYAVVLCGLLSIVLAVLVTWRIVGGPTPSHEAPLSHEAGLGHTASAHAPEANPTAVSLLAHATTARTPSRSAYLLYAWLAGVSIMLIRIVSLTRGVRKLRRQWSPLNDPHVVAALDELRTIMRVSRRVTLAVADTLASPIAMGLFWPAVALPTSVVTGLTPDQLRAVLAHELAHIRRYDYLVNFVQLFIEALLYFNPAVWWLSRQARVEREACCDAIAARVTGSPVDYATTLAHIARGLSPNPPVTATAQAFGADQSGGRLLDRTRRLLLPGYWPTLRLRWYSMALGALLSSAMLLGLYQGSAMGVAIMGRLLSDSERIKVMSQLSEKFGRQSEPDYSVIQQEKVEVSGVIVTPDGKPLPPNKGYFLHGMSVGSYRNGSYGASAGFELNGNRFHGTFVKGNLYVFAEFPGYAPTAVGPLRGEAGHPITDVTIHLAPGQPASVRFVDSHGAPIPGVRVNGWYKFLPNMGSWTLHLRSDKHGIVSIEQARPPVPVSLEARALGFQQARNENLVVKGNQVFDWVLQPDKPVRGLVVDKRTGTPIPNATVALLYERGQGFVSNSKGKLLATSGRDGKFELRGLDQRKTYYFLVAAHGFGSEILSNAYQTTVPWQIALHPRYVHGTIRGDLTQLKQNPNGSGPVISSIMTLSIPGDGSTYGTDSQFTPVTIKNGVGTFTINNLRRGRLHIFAGRQTVGVNVNDPIKNLKITLGPAPKRRQRTVDIELPVPKGAPPAAGSLDIKFQNTETGRYHNDQQEAVTNGHARFTVEVPARLTLTADGLSGYIPRPIPENDRKVIYQGWLIPDGAKPFVITVPLERAGAVYVKVIGADGRPVSPAAVSVRPRSQREDSHWPEDFFQSNTMDLNCKGQGEIAVLPLPYDWDFEITARAGFSESQKTFTLTARAPIRHEQLQLPQGVDTVIRVLKPDGTPASDTPIRIETANHGYSGMRTDAKGRFKACGMALNRKYWASIEPDSSYQHVCVPVRLNAPETVIRLTEGLRVEGVALTSGTDSPVPNFVVSAHAVLKPTGPSAPVYQVKTLTDQEGRFRFTNLAPGTYTLGTGPLQVPSRQPSTFTAGQKAPIIIHVRPNREDLVRTSYQNH